METAAISYRVADFLKHHPPFNAIDDADLLELAAGHASIPDVTQHIMEASRLGERVDAVIKGRNAELTPP